MKEQPNTIIKEELEFYIRNNIVAKKIKSIKLNKKVSTTVEEPTGMMGHMLGNFDFSFDLSKFHNS